MNELIAELVVFLGNVNDFLSGHKVLQREHSPVDTYGTDKWKVTDY